MYADLIEHLESKEKFVPLLMSFLNKSISEQYIKSDDSSPLSYAAFYSQFAKAVMTNNSDCVSKFCESPIERVFLNSLILMCVRNRMPCFHFTPPAEDVLSYMQNYRDFHLAIIKHIQSYKDATGDDDLVNFEKAVQVRMEQGIYSQEQVEEIYMHNSIIKNFEWNSYKITIQAGFPNLKLNGKSLRTDLFIWVPGDDAVKIIIECDGYAYHSSKESFQNDRQRDRLFQMNGYKVIRFSGAEINRDPVKVSSELLDLLEVLDIDNAEKRIL
jgi:hypothetical protein